MQKPSEDAAKKKARAERFKQEAKAGPPPLPVRKMAHPGGKIVTSDKEKVLQKLIDRKVAAGEALTADQQRALAERSNTNQEMPARMKKAMEATDISDAAPPPPKSQPQVQNNIPIAPSPQQADSKRIKALRKKLHEISLLEARKSEGAVLQENQLTKIANKEAIETELKALGEDVKSAPECCSQSVHVRPRAFNPPKM